MLKKYVSDNNIDLYINNKPAFKDKDQARRTYYLIDLLHKEIAKERIAALCDKSQRPKPYNSENLKEIEIDNNNLVNIKEFDINNPGYQFNNFVYCLVPSTDQLNASFWISKAIKKFAEGKKLNFKIRLDPFIEKPRSEYRMPFYKMLVYGKRLDWDRLKGLHQNEFGQWIDTDQSSEIGTTDFVWRPEGNEIHFTCEELPKIDYIDYRGSRFLHAIFDKVTGYIKHFDGAVRFYTSGEFNKRMKYHVRSPEVRKIGNRVKIFQIDDIINQNIFIQLTTSYFVWNEDIQSYFR